MLNPTTQGIAYITGNINKRPINFIYRGEIKDVYKRQALGYIS